MKTLEELSVEELVEVVNEFTNNQNVSEVIENIIEEVCFDNPDDDEFYEVLLDCLDLDKNDEYFEEFTKKDYDEYKKCIEKIKNFLIF